MKKFDSENRNETMENLAALLEAKIVEVPQDLKNPRYKKQWRVLLSHSTTPEPKIVSLTIDGKYQCSCPGWTFQRKPCRHIEAVMKE